MRMCGSFRCFQQGPNSSSKDWSRSPAQASVAGRSCQAFGTAAGCGVLRLRMIFHRRRRSRVSSGARREAQSRSFENAETYPARRRCDRGCFFAYVAMQPSTTRIERSAIFVGPVETAFAEVNDFHNWQAWSPWAKLDPNAKATFEGPASGKAPCSTGTATAKSAKAP